METKKSRVTKLTKKDKDSYGKFSFVLEFENGDKGFYSTKDENQTFFMAGNVADYMIEAKTSKAGSTYYLITHPEDQKQQGFAGGGKPRTDPKLQLAAFAMSYTKDLIVGGKLDLTALESGFNRIHALMSAKL